MISIIILVIKENTIINSEKFSVEWMNCPLLTVAAFSNSHFVAAFLEVHVLFSNFLHQSLRCLDIIHSSLFSLLK
jgi:hypothetical protein